MEGYYTVKEAAEILNVSRQCIESLISRNRLKYTKTNGILRADMINYLLLRIDELDTEKKKIKSLLNSLQ